MCVLVFFFVCFGFELIPLPPTVFVYSDCGWVGLCVWKRLHFIFLLFFIWGKEDRMWSKWYTDLSSSMIIDGIQNGIHICLRIYWYAHFLLLRLSITAAHYLMRIVTISASWCSIEKVGKKKKIREKRSARWPIGLNEWIEVIDLRTWILHATDEKQRYPRRVGIRSLNNTIIIDIYCINSESNLRKFYCIFPVTIKS